MGMIGTFDGFTASRLGIYAAQQALRVTGNNIANISTPGYTRQRVDQSSFKAGANDMYRSKYDNHIGSGALVTGINQIRDPYLDIRYRATSTDTYHYDTWLAGLREIASILDEVGKGENNGDGMLYAQLQDLAGKLRSFSANPTNSNDGLARESASALASLFRNYAGLLQEVYNGTETNFRDNITEVNDILTNIRDLNKSIREAEIHGDTALEMRDERNRQIDALSQFMGIKVEYSYEDIGAGIEVEKLTIKLNNTNPDPNVTTDESILVDGIYATQLSVPDEKPVLNTYKDAYLQGYKYLKALTADEATEFLKDYPDKTLTLGSLQPMTKDGATYYLVGTNNSNVEGIVTEKNDNFTIQLGKLLNAKGAEWKGSTTRWTEVEGKRTDAKAQFAYAVSGKNLKAGDTFVINNQTYTVGNATAGNTISLADAQDDTKFAEFVAARLPVHQDYLIEAKNGQIIYTAREGKEGVIGSANAPAAMPSLELKDPGSVGLITLGSRVTLNPGYTVGPPEGVELDKPEYTYDEYGQAIKAVSYTLVDGKYYRIQIDTKYTHEVALDDNDLRGILQAQRELLTEEGEFSGDYDVLIDEEAAIKRGIPYYQKALDLMAQKFAETYNELNMGFSVDQDGNYLDKDGNVLDLKLDDVPVNRNEELTDAQKAKLIELEYYLKDKDGNPVDKHGNPVPDDQKVPDLDTWLAVNHAYRPGGVLFSNGNNGNDTTGITAKNIDISSGWSHGDWGLVPKYEKIYIDESNPDGMAQTTKNTNADHMLALIEKSLTYDPRDLYGSDATGPLLFEGSFNDFFSKMMSVEAGDERVTNIRLTNSATSLTELDYSREGVSGVDLNDEAMNMMQFSKAMNAAMRVMTAIDEVLDRLINNTGVAGR